MKFRYFFRYFTVWVLVAHIISLAPVRIIPNLIPTAVYTFIGSVVNNTFVNKDYDFIIDVMLHIFLPAAFITMRYTLSGQVVPRVVTWGSMVVFPVAILFAYLLWNRFNFQRILMWYEHPSVYCCAASSNDDCSSPPNSDFACADM